MAQYKIRENLIAQNAATISGGLTIATGSLVTGASGMAVNSGTTVTKLYFGNTTFTCASSGSALSGSSGSANITVANVTAGDFVMVTTGSLPGGTFLTGASATAASVITLYFRNSACTDTIDALCNAKYFVVG